MWGALGRRDGNSDSVLVDPDFILVGITVIHKNSPEPIPPQEYHLALQPNTLEVTIALKRVVGHNEIFLRTNVAVGRLTWPYMNRIFGKDAVFSFDYSSGENRKDSYTERKKSFWMTVVSGIKKSLGKDNSNSNHDNSHSEDILSVSDFSSDSSQVDGPKLRYTPLYGKEPVSVDVLKDGNVVPFNENVQWKHKVEMLVGLPIAGGFFVGLAQGILVDQEDKNVESVAIAFKFIKAAAVTTTAITAAFYFLGNALKQPVLIAALLLFGCCFGLKNFVLSGSGNAAAGVPSRSAEDYLDSSSESGGQTQFVRC